jgi:hypothetical protein
LKFGFINDSYSLDGNNVKGKALGKLGKKTPLWKRAGFTIKSKAYYRLPLLDALSGLSLFCWAPALLVTWEAMLQSPVFHFNAGSGQAVQNHPEENSALRSQPLHFSTISWQIPPL